MIQVKIKLRLGLDNQKAAVSVFRSLLERVRVLPGCLSCHLYVDVEEPEFLLFEEKWQTQKSLDEHLRSDLFRQVLLVMEAASEPPEVGFDRVDDSTGMEMVERARARSGYTI